MLTKVVCELKHLMIWRQVLFTQESFIHSYTIHSLHLMTFHIKRTDISCVFLFFYKAMEWLELIKYCKWWYQTDIYHWLTLHANMIHHPSLLKLSNKIIIYRYMLNINAYIFYLLPIIEFETTICLKYWMMIYLLKQHNYHIHWFISIVYWNYIIHV